MLKQRKFNTVLFAAILILGIFACSDLIEESIQDKVVVVITPTDGTISTNYTQTFWWEELKYALNYRLQIVYNKFDSAAEFRLDTLLSSNKFSVTLKPAKYQWRIEALNGSSKTEIETIQNLRIDSTSIEGQDILLTSPGNGLISNDSDFNFQWEALPGATDYRFQLYYSSNNTVVLDSTVRTETSFNYVIERDSTYYWTVTAKRKDIYSNPSESWKFTLDRESPDSVKLTSPSSGAGVSSPVTLTWSAPNDPGLAYYEIYIFKGSTSTPFSDKYNPYKTVNDSSPLKKSFSFTEGSLNDRIIWKVRAVDKAGNKSSGEKTRTFIIN